MRTPEGATPITSYGGISGSAVYIIQSNSESFLAGFVYEANFAETVARLPGPIRDLAREIPGEHGSGPRAMTFGLPPVRLVADFRALAVGTKTKSPGNVATVSKLPVFRPGIGYAECPFADSRCESRLDRLS